MTREVMERDVGHAQLHNRHGTLFKLGLYTTRTREINLHRHTAMYISIIVMSRPREHVSSMFVNMAAGVPLERTYNKQGSVLG